MMVFPLGPARDSIAEAAEECEELVIHILQDIPQEPSEWAECCIYRVPKQLRKVNPEAYDPKLVSIGPFHHNRAELKDMEKHKQKYLMDFLFRTQKSQMDLKDNDKILLALLKIIKDNEKKIRDSYSEDCGLKSGDFVKMILLDAIFILELFLKDDKKEQENDYISSQPWLQNGILHDLILLENQLPFFVLEKLYMFALTLKEGLEKEDTPFVKLSCRFFSWYDYRMNKNDSIGKKVKHFTDLVRYLFGSVPDVPLQEPLNTPHCATKLDNAGLKFKAAEERPLLEIKLHRNSFRCFDCSCLLACLPCLKCFPGLESMQCFLEIPPLQIDDYTEVIFRNLMALEQCHYPSHTYICNYVVLLDCLINTEEDLDLLIDEKVIDNQLGSNTAVVKLINNLGDQITVTNSRYSEIARELNDHYDYPLNHILATLTSVYFRDFWRGTASIVGLVVLGLTFFNFLRPYVK